MTTRERPYANKLPAGIGETLFHRLAAKYDPQPEPEPQQHRAAARPAPAVTIEAAPAEETIRVASLKDIPAGFTRMGTGFYRSGHNIWELRPAEADDEGYVLVRKQEERALDFRASAAAPTLTPAPAQGLVRGQRVFVAQMGGMVEGIVEGLNPDDTVDIADEHGHSMDQSVPVELVFIVDSDALKDAIPGLSDGDTDADDAEPEPEPCACCGEMECGCSDANRSAPQHSSSSGPSQGWSPRQPDDTDDADASDDADDGEHHEARSLRARDPGTPRRTPREPYAPLVENEKDMREEQGRAEKRIKSKQESEEEEKKKSKDFPRSGRLRRRTAAADVGDTVEEHGVKYKIVEVTPNVVKAEDEKGTPRAWKASEFHALVAKGSITIAAPQGSFGRGMSPWTEETKKRNRQRDMSHIQDVIYGPQRGAARTPANLSPQQQREQDRLTPEQRRDQEDEHSMSLAELHSPEQNRKRLERRKTQQQVARGAGRRRMAALKVADLRQGELQFLAEGAAVADGLKPSQARVTPALREAAARFSAELGRALESMVGDATSSALGRAAARDLTLKAYWDLTGMPHGLEEALPDLAPGQVQTLRRALHQVEALRGAAADLATAARSSVLAA